MSAIAGVVKGGRVIFEEPVELPEGTKVEVFVVASPSAGCGMREEDYPTTPQGIADLVKRMDKVPGGWLSPEDEASWRKAMQEQKEYDLS